MKHSIHSKPFNYNMLLATNRMHWNSRLKPCRLTKERERERRIYLQWNFCVDLKLTMLAYEWFRPPQFHSRWSRSLSKCNESHWKLQSTEWAHSHWQIKQKKLGCIKHSSSRAHTKKRFIQIAFIIKKCGHKINTTEKLCLECWRLWVYPLSHLFILSLSLIHSGV